MDKGMQVGTGAESDWTYMVSLLPEGWDQMAADSGALLKCRKFRQAEDLLRVLMIHLVDGCSLKETVVRAKTGGLVDISSVALFKRLRAAGEWFRMMSVAMMQQSVPIDFLAGVGLDLPVRLVDATCVSRPGSTGADWRLHYSMDVPDLRCRDIVAGDHTAGESFKNFRVEPGLVYVGDRGYCHREGVHYIVSGGGHVVVRLNHTGMPLLAAKSGRPFSILSRLARLSAKEVGDWSVAFDHGGERVEGRFCAVKKTKVAAEISREKLIREHRRKQKRPSAGALQAAGYVFLFTTLPADRLSAKNALELYRGRWQVELLFKRLKSLLGASELQKTTTEGVKAWLHGKIFAALLIENLVAAGERFFPWGYPFGETVS